MRTLLTIAFAALAAVSLFAADLAGTWKGAMETQMGQAEIVIKVQPGTGLAGTIKAGDFEGPIENAKVDGNNFSFEFNISHGKVVYKGTVAGDEMKLNVTGTQGDQYKLVCKRQK